MRFQVAVILIISAVAFVFTACGAAADTAAEVVYTSDDAVVIVAKADGGSLYDVLTKLSEDGKLSFSGSESEYGFYIEEVNGRAAEASANEFWAIYTTLGELDGVAYSSTEFGSYEYDGMTLASASYGVSGLPVVEDEHYALVLETY